MRISDWSSDVCSSDLVLTSLRWARRRNITFKFDSAHPIGAAHHQKIVVIDDALAFCGGIDMTADRWDTLAHLEDDPRRRRPSGRRSEEHTSELQSLMRNSYAVFCLKKKNNTHTPKQ